MIFLALAVTTMNMTAYWAIMPLFPCDVVLPCVGFLGTLGNRPFKEPILLILFILLHSVHLGP
jgi:hypothetical protein